MMSLYQQNTSIDLLYIQGQQNWYRMSPGQSLQIHNIDHVKVEFDPMMMQWFLQPWIMAISIFRVYLTSI